VNDKLQTKHEIAEKYFRFSPDGSEVHILRPDTPMPWAQYLFNDKYHCIITQNGGGFSYAYDPKVNRIHRWDNIENDMPGRYLFFKEKDEVWSANWQPMKSPYQKWETVFAPGTAVIRSEMNGFDCKQEIFVPLDQTMEITMVTIRNLRPEQRTVSVYPFIEVVAGDFDLEVRYRNIMKLYNKSLVDFPKKTLVLFKKPTSAREIESYVFFRTSLDYKSFDTDKLGFFGVYHSVEDPQGLHAESLGNRLVNGKDMVGVFQHEMSFGAGEEKKFFLITGFSGTRQGIDKACEKFGTFEDVEKEFRKTGEYWNNMLAKVVIESGDRDMDLMANVWGKYQLLGITRWRGTSHYHGTEGGLGYRDLAQDVEGIAGLDPVLAKQKLIRLMGYQYQNGNAVSGYSELEGPWDTGSDTANVSGKADVAVWLPNAVSKYLKETGDTRFLKQKVPYLNSGSDTVYSHVVKAVRYISRTLGKHGLPLIKKADWNDAFDKIGTGGKGESVWLGEALCWAALKVKEIAEHIGDTKISREMTKIFSTMKKAVNKHGWNGDHYIAAMNDAGRKIGDKTVSLNSQTWAILGEVCDSPEKTAKVLIAIDKLDTPWGNLLFAPPFHEYEKDIGRVTAFAEGTKENAAVFSHAVGFKVVADCLAGRNNEAWATMRKLLPMVRSGNDVEGYKVEPYVWSEYVIGQGNEQYGEGVFTWNTGTAVWTYIAVTEWIMGVKPSFDGLVIEPGLPDSVRKVKMRRSFRNCIYDIEIEKKGCEPGLVLDGKPVKGRFVKAFKDGKEHKVKFCY
jgi:cellobiose phosphorylase